MNLATINLATMNLARRAPTHLFFVAIGAQLLFTLLGCATAPKALPPSQPPKALPPSQPRQASPQTAGELNNKSSDIEDSNEIPLEVSKGQLIIKASVNGSQPLRFRFATMGGVFLDRQSASALGLKVRFLNSRHSKNILEVVEGASVTLAARTSPNINLRVSDISAYKRESGASPIDGLLGFDFFSNSKICLDLGRNTFAYDDCAISSSSRISGSVSLPYELVFGLPQIRTHVDGNPAILLLDLSESRPLLMALSYAKKNKYIQAKPSQRGKFNLNRVHRVVLGPSIVLSDVPIEVIDNPESQQPGSTFAGILGASALANYQVIIDYPARQLTIRSVEVKK